MIKADGKQLFALGCPQNKIKFFVGKEFDSEEALIVAFSEQTEGRHETFSPDSAYSFLLSLSHLPVSIEGKNFTSPSKGEVKRWLENGAVLINGEKPKPHDEVEFPITQLVFFPNSKRKTTMF